MELAIGSVVDGRYRVERMLGQGGQASVYLVQHEQLGSRHAMKLVEAMPTARTRILREGQAQAALKHPHIVRVTDVVQVDARLGLIMEYVEGPDLARVIRHRRLDLAQVDLVARAVLSAMVAAHSHGLVHRDLKPENILLDRGVSGVVPKVTDFGLALRVHAPTRQTPSGAVLGTPYYMSPEQVKDGRSVDHRTDVWAIGAILYELLAGRVPFDGNDLLEVWNKVERASPTSLVEIEPNLPQRMIRTVERALSRDPAARFPDCQTMLTSWEDGEVAPGADDTMILDLDLAPYVEPSWSGPDVPGQTTWRASTIGTGIAMGVGMVGLLTIAGGAVALTVVIAVALGLGPFAPDPEEESLTAASTPLVVGAVPGSAPVRAEPAPDVPVLATTTKSSSPSPVTAAPGPEEVVEAPVAVARRTGRVVSTGARVSLLAGPDRFEVPGGVPVGTYEVVVAFGANPSFVYPEGLVVDEGVTYEVRCNAGTQLCTYVRTPEAP